jgi:hypothetical protein
MDMQPDPSAVVQPAVRARLWVSGYRLWPPDGYARLWLALSDGRALALRLGGRWLGKDEAIAPIVAALADDAGGHRYSLTLPEVDYVHVLYAAPVVPSLARDSAAFVLDPDFQSYVAALDREVVALLASLERPDTPAAITGYPVGREPHPPPARYLASIRNYNRLAALPTEQRERRMQALRRFPALVAPVLLTLHHSPNHFDGKRHAWRNKAGSVEAAIDQGRDLVGALARFWEISRGLVRSPINAVMWGDREAGRRRAFLAFLDALPDNQRPDIVEFERWAPYLMNYFGLLWEEGEGIPPPKLAEVHRNAFHLGWQLTWRAAARRHGNLLTALADCGDFLDAVRDRAAVMLKRPYGPSRRRLAAGWLACFGLLGLLDASARWHRLRPWPEKDPTLPDFDVPEIVGRLEEDGKTAQELFMPALLQMEGMTMRHCVGGLNYWLATVEGARIFHLERSDERATAFYQPRALSAEGEDAVYELVQLRGPCNQDVSETMEAWAERVGNALNDPARQERRRAALRCKSEALAARWQERRALHFQQHPLDPKTERQLKRALAWLGETLPGPDVLLVAHVAGFEYHDGPQVEEKLAVGDALALVHEPANAHDALAVRLDWQGHKLGYVPRPHNEEIAARLMAGARLAAHIAEIDRAAQPWRRVRVMIRHEEGKAAG